MDTKEEITLKDIRYELETIYTQFSMVENVLSVFEERLDEDVAFFKEYGDCHGAMFASGYDILRSVFDVAMIQFHSAVEDMGRQVPLLFAH